MRKRRSTVFVRPGKDVTLYIPSDTPPGVIDYLNGLKAEGLFSQGVMEIIVNAVMREGASLPGSAGWESGSSAPRAEGLDKRKDPRYPGQESGREGADRPLDTNDLAGAVHPRGANDLGGAVHPRGANESVGAAHPRGANDPGGAAYSRGANESAGAVHPRGANDPGGAVHPRGANDPAGAAHPRGANDPGGAVHPRGSTDLAGSGYPWRQNDRGDTSDHPLGADGSANPAYARRLEPTGYSDKPEAEGNDGEGPEMNGQAGEQQPDERKKFSLAQIFRQARANAGKLSQPTQPSAGNRNDTNESV